MKKHVRLVVVLPVGPNDGFLDTIESVKTYCGNSLAILAVDDSRSAPTASLLAESLPQVIRIEPSRYSGVYGALFGNLTRGYAYAIDNFEFDVLLRIDCDALIIGAAPEEHAGRFFRDHAGVGVLGSYKTDSNGEARNFERPAAQILREARGLGPAREYQAILRDWLGKAKINGYQVGEHCLGGAVFIRPEVLRAMADHGFFARAEAFHASGIGEDHLFGMLTVACGYEMADFATGDLPLDLRWRGMPRAPQDVDSTVKKIVHSTKYWQHMTQNDIHEYYRTRRSEYIASQGHRV